MSSSGSKCLTLVDCVSQHKIGPRLKLYLNTALLIRLRTCWSKDGWIGVVKHDAAQLGSLSGYESWSSHAHTACAIPAASVLLCCVCCLVVLHLVLHAPWIYYRWRTSSSCVAQERRSSAPPSEGWSSVPAPAFFLSPTAGFTDFSYSRPTSPFFSRRGLRINPY